MTKSRIKGKKIYHGRSMAEIIPVGLVDRYGYCSGMYLYMAPFITARTNEEYELLTTDMSQVFERRIQRKLFILRGFSCREVN